MKKYIKELQKKANDEVIKLVKSAIYLSIEDKTDILGIGRLFYQNHPNYYKNNWNGNIDEVDFNIYSNLIINNKVSSKDSLEGNHEW